MNINEYVEKTRRLTPKTSRNRKDGYSIIEEFFNHVVQDRVPLNVTSKIDLLNVSSYSAIIETLELKDTHYIIYDIHYGDLLEFLNLYIISDFPEKTMLNFLLNSVLEFSGWDEKQIKCINRKYFDKNELKRSRNYKYLAQKQRKSIRNTVLFFTQIQECFIIFHELFHIILDVNPLPKNELKTFKEDMHRDIIALLTGAPDLILNHNTEEQLSKTYNRHVEWLKNDEFMYEMACDMYATQLIYELYDPNFPNQLGWIFAAMYFGIYFQQIILNLREISYMLTSGEKADFYYIDGSILRNLFFMIRRRADLINIPNLQNDFELIVDDFQNLLISLTNKFSDDKLMEIKKSILEIVYDFKYKESSNLPDWVEN